jgi:IS5 family transposase
MSGKRTPAARSPTSKLSSACCSCKQHNTDKEKKAIKDGRIPDGWKDKPAKLAQKDRDARWTVKYTKARPREGGVPQVDLAIPGFGYKNHVSIDRRHGLIHSSEC